MKTKLRKLISQWKDEIKTLKQNPEDCTREKMPVVFGKIAQLQVVIWELEWLLKNDKKNSNRT